MKARHLLMSAALAGAAWLAFFGDKSPDTEAVAPLTREPALPAPAAAIDESADVARSSAPGEAEAPAARKETGTRILSLRPRAELIGSPSSGQWSDGLFAARSWTPPPRPAKPEEAPPPAAPPLPFKYLGKQTNGGQTQVYLASGDQIIVARERSVIQNTYRVESIQPPTLSLTYLPLNQIQRLSIGVTN